MLTLSAYHFRSYHTLRWSCASPLTVLIGPNGAGKTNLLEALSLFGPGRGLRQAPLTAMQAWGQSDPWSLALTLDQDIPLEFVTQLAPPRRRVIIQSAPRPALGLLDHVLIPWLTPDMDTLWTEGQQARRRWLDRAVVERFPLHAAALQRYQKLWDERNRLLSQASGQTRWLETLEHQLAEATLPILDRRQKYGEELMQGLVLVPLIQPIMALQGLVEDAWRKDRGGCVVRLQAEWAQERALYPRSRWGCHRTQVALTWRGHDAAWASTGEQKALLVACFLAHLALLKGGGRPMIILWDEVTAHLDETRRAAVWAYLHSHQLSVVMTGCERSAFKDLKDAVFWNVKDDSRLSLSS